MLRKRPGKNIDPENNPHSANRSHSREQTSKDYSSSDSSSMDSKAWSGDLFEAMSNCKDPVVNTPLHVCWPRLRKPRRQSSGTFAEPLAKKLWRKRERERIKELDATLQRLNLEINQNELLYHKAHFERDMQKCEQLNEKINQLLECKVLFTKEKLNLKAKVARKSQKCRTL